MTPLLRLVLRWLALVTAAVPVAFVATILLVPLWGRIERRWGIESVGHSGPAEWCFWTMYVISLGALSLLARWLRADADRARAAARDD